MILWCDGDHDPAENMHRDALLLSRAEAVDAEPVLRLFRFRPYGITLGYAQRPEWELDLDGCRAAGVPWAVRPTGGRAIFHAEEWTYSLAARLEDAQWGGSLTQSYDAISRLLVRSLIRLGIPAQHAAATARPVAMADDALTADRHHGIAATTSSAKPAPAAPCFASTARHEVVLEGRKLVGSAQRRTARALLQQGSVLLGKGHLRVTDYLAIDRDHQEAARATLESRAIEAGQYLEPEAPLERWADVLASELPGARRLDGAAGAFLLTPPESGSYTAALR